MLNGSAVSDEVRRASNVESALGDREVFGGGRR
jgi:hypothetical protein